MKKIFEDVFEYNVIYVYEVKDELHKGLIKIGKASLKTQKSIDQLTPNCKELNQAAKKRIKEYTNTMGFPSSPIYTELAIRTVKDIDGKPQILAFSDHDVHNVLKNSGYKNQSLKGSTSKEWFKIDLATAVKAIAAVKNSKGNLAGQLDNLSIEIDFRPEQIEAINKTIKQFKTHDTMLWNAKMRFGKTLSALQVIKKMQFKTTIIITHRPVVDDGWYEDFSKIFRNDDGYIYGSKNKGYTVKELIQSDASFIYFASIQDLRGSEVAGGKYDKNNEVFSLNWDFVIVDEAHEGTTTELGNNVLEYLVKKDNGYTTKVLELSGTPFNLLDKYEDNIYTWDYIMEQRAKKEWTLNHFGDYNPYEDLPEMKIYTYDLGKIIGSKQYVELEDKAFNFKEFFRVWTGDIKNDRKQMPEGKQIGDFYHENDVKSFLNLMTSEDESSNFPYSNQEYRNLFKHSLWIVPGVKEARALSKLMKQHPVFGCGLFDIVNVAGEGDEEEKSEDALKKVRKAIDNAGNDGYTITLSCGKLTTGVTVREWTSVFMLSGSFSTSAANYLQTIFRVQSPCNINGKIKTSCYVFDFAPDRTLKMVAESVALSTKAGKANESDKRMMGEFLNYCPVISVYGSEMKEYNTNKLLQQLKRAYAEKAVKNGFDDINLYNDELLKMDELEIEKFKNLKDIIGASKISPISKDIDLNKQGFTEEEYEEAERINKKKKKDRTPEEEEILKEMKKKKKEKNKAISILRGISIRMPLLIYGADFDIEEDITMDKLVNKIDDSSWNEFMPIGVTKELFRSFIKYYDAEIFAAAGRKIRDIVKKADLLPPLERIKAITDLFSCFKNPDKETVLTPWRVVNMHMGDCLGGYVFYDEKNENLLDTPRFVNNGEVTEKTLANNNSRILEINSKTGLYPLYLTYSIFRNRCSKYTDKDLTMEVQEKLWMETVSENIFVICKTPMAKDITKRTLVGFKETKVNAHYFDDLINMLENKSENFVSKVTKASYWKMKGESIVKFDAIVGNPPYQINDGGFGDSAKPVYNLFISQAKAINPQYLSMIVPARWYSGGKGLDEFRREMLNDNQLTLIHDFPNTSECFSNVNIRGGVCYFLWTRDVHDDCIVFNHQNHKISSVLKRPLLEKNAETFIRYNKAISILRKVQAFCEPTMNELVSSRKPFGLTTNFKNYSSKKTYENNIYIHRFGDNGYIAEKQVLKNQEWIDKIKVIIPYASPGADDYPHLILSKPIVAKENEVCTETYLVIGPLDNELYAENLISYMRTKFFRFMLLLLKSTQHITQKVYSFVPQQELSQKWDDKKLYEKYHITDDEIAFINTLIKEVNW